MSTSDSEDKCRELAEDMLSDEEDVTEDDINELVALLETTAADYISFTTDSARRKRISARAEDQTKA